MKRREQFFRYLVLLHILLSALSYIASQSQIQATTIGSVSTRQSFVSLLISAKGLDFVKELLISKAISSLIPLEIPRIENTQKIPIIGSVHVVISNITIYQIDVAESYIKPGESGIAIIVSGATANLSLQWGYSYTTSWFAPFEISDRGKAEIEVQGLQVGLAFGLVNKEGTLKLSLLQSGCFVEDIRIKLDGGASWLYQGLIDAFEDQIVASVENTITKKLEEGIIDLDAFLQDLPKRIPVDDVVSFNVTLIDEPAFSNSSIGFDINGLFIPKEKIWNLEYTHKNTATLSCDDSSKMLGIAVDEDVFDSASVLYFNAGFMQWIVDEIPNQSLLNTAGWRFIIPQLYKKYPNRDMNLNISLASPPELKIEDNIDVTVYTDLIIDVIEAGEVIPVACIFLDIRASGSVQVVGNNLAGSVKLHEFEMSLKWSRIGNLRMFLIQPVIWTLIETVFLPYANAHLAKGFPLPIIRGFILQDAEITFTNSRIMVCSDLAYTQDFRRALVHTTL